MDSSTASAFAALISAIAASISMAALAIDIWLRHKKTCVKYVQVRNKNENGSFDFFTEGSPIRSGTKVTSIMIKADNTVVIEKENETLAYSAFIKWSR